MELWTLIFILVITTVLVFCFWVSYRWGFIKGYKAGATRVLNEWKDVMKNEEDVNNG